MVSSILHYIGNEKSMHESCILIISHVINNIKRMDIKEIKDGSSTCTPTKPAQSKGS